MKSIIDKAITLRNAKKLSKAINDTGNISEEDIQKFNEEVNLLSAEKSNSEEREDE